MLYHANTTAWALMNPKKKKKIKCRTVGTVSSMAQRPVQLRFSFLSFFLSFSLFYVHIRAMVCVLTVSHTASSEMA